MTATEKRKIALIGAGNVAWHLGQALVAAGHDVIAVHSRSKATREQLCNILPGAVPFVEPNFTGTNAELVIIAVPDAALELVASTLKVANTTIVAHTSGSQPLAVLSRAGQKKVGVFYPLQTFSKIKQVDFTNLPILVEALDESTKALLTEVAYSISTQVLDVDSDRRKQLHLAAVFACNFTNHLFGISKQMLQEAGLPDELLQPLIQETIAKASQQNPYEVQTGPAIRHDENVISEHLTMLEAHPLLQELYKNLTKSIQAISKHRKN